jgi:hypothetical protein
MGRTTPNKGLATNKSSCEIKQNVTEKAQKVIGYHEIDGKLNQIISARKWRTYKDIEFAVKLNGNLLYKLLSLGPRQKVTD